MASIQTPDQRPARVLTSSVVRTGTTKASRRPERDVSPLEVIARQRSASLLEPTHRILRRR